MIKESLTAAVDKAYGEEKAAQEAKFNTTFAPKLRATLSDPEKRQLFYVNYLRQFWRDLFYLILQTGGSYYENSLVMLAFGNFWVRTVQHKDDEEIRQAWNIVNDMTPEEYEQCKKENKWLETA